MRRLLLLLACALVLGACDKTPVFQGRDITGMEYGQAVELPDYDGQPRRIASFAGKVTVVFFGYTHCPDVCPTTLGDLARALELLGADAAKVQVVFITVDPQRDSPQMLKRYVTAFNPSFLALRGDPEATRKAAADFKVFYEEVPGSSPENYTVNHSTGSFIYDTAGRLRVYVSHGLGAEVFAHDIRELLRAAG